MNRFFTLLLAASCLTAVGQVPDYVPTDGLLAWFDVNGSFTDELSNIEAMSIDISFVQDRESTPDEAMEFNGSTSWISLGDIDPISEGQAGELSFSFWCSPYSWNDQHLSFLFGDEIYQNDGVLLQLDESFSSLTAFPGPGSSYVACECLPEFNNWTHVVYVQNAESIQVYLDGSGFMLSNSLNVETEDPWRIGAFVGGAYFDRVFHGAMDEVGFWTRALTEDEVYDLFIEQSQVQGCTDSSACNFDLEAAVDDGSCTLADCTDPQACNFNSEAACDDGNCVYAPTIDLGEDIVSCDEWVVLEAQDGQFFQWSTGESNSIIEVSQTGLYAVEASSQVGEPNVIAGHTFIGRLGQSDYYISEASISWEDARTQSESLGGHLAVITSPEENELVWQGVFGNGLNPGGTNNYQAWIGLYQDFESPDYAEPNGGWRWVTDEAVSYLNWAANRPGNLDQGYFVHMTDANGNCPEGDIACGTWDDSGISTNLQSAFYVLEVESPYGSCTTSDSVFVEFNHGSCFCGPGTIWDAEMQLCIGDGSGDINLDGCVQLNDLLDLLSAYGNCTAEESPWQCGDPLEYQGYDYETVQIGEQCWFAENLRAEYYRNGDAISSTLSDGEWSSTSMGAVAVYGEGLSDCNGFNPDGNACDEYWSLNEYGRLYNWFAVDDARGLCPHAWSVPADGDWMELELILGLDSTLLYSAGYRGDSAGIQLRDDVGWFEGGNGNDAVGYSARPAGYRYAPSGTFSQAGKYAQIWTSSTITDEGAIARLLAFEEVGVKRSSLGRTRGISVRCIKDVE